MPKEEARATIATTGTLGLRKHLLQVGRGQSPQWTYL